VLRHAAGRSAAIDVYGTDYPTPDGTAVRDFVHVDDLARAHILALERCRGAGRFAAYNLGTGTGSTVREVLRAAEEITGRRLQIRERPRRPGDPAFLVASNVRAREDLGWEPACSLAEIIDSAWRWHRRHPRGYRSLVRPESAVLKSRRGSRGG